MLLLPKLLKSSLRPGSVFAGIFVLSFASLNCESAQYVFDFNHVFGGTSPASLTTPWIEAEFSDISPGVVSLTVSNLHLSGTENVDALYFNLSPSLNPNSLAFSYQNGAGKFKTPDITQGTNAFKAGGDGKYDLLFSFTTGMTDNQRFNSGESMTYFISGIPGLSAADFTYLSAPDGGAGPFFAAAHVQRLGAGSLSGWVATDMISPVVVPEPNASLLFSLLIAIWLGIRLTRKLSTANESPKRQLIRLPKNETRRHAR